MATCWRKCPLVGRKRLPPASGPLADAVLTMPDLRGRLGEIPVPVWACTGESDAGPMAFNELCEKNIEACSRAVIPGCGHYPMLDAAEEFIGQLENFLGASPGGAAPEARPRRRHGRTLSTQEVSGDPKRGG